MKLIMTISAILLASCLPASATLKPADAPTVFPSPPGYAACLERGARWEFHNAIALDAIGGCNLEGEVLPEDEKE